MFPYVVNKNMPLSYGFYFGFESGHLCVAFQYFV